MSLDSRRAGVPRLNAANSNVFKIKAHPGLLGPDQNDQAPPPEVEITYSDLRTIGNGSFGVVFQANLMSPTQERVAIKKVLQDKRFKNRELQIMRKLDHCNVVKLKYFFHTTGDQRGSPEVYLHLVLEFIPETLYKIARAHARVRQNFPIIWVKIYMYQLFRSLNYIHSMDICHRDIKPQNLLLDPETGVLKLCDFGSAKSLVSGEPNVAYICSRYYRAPELIFGATDYTTKIDIWSAGCVMAEMILGEPMFPGESGVDQLVEIIKVLGTPTREQMRAMNRNYTEFRFPVIRARSWTRIFSSSMRTPPEAARLVSNLLEYTPSNRLTPLSACAHPFFDELRPPNPQVLPNGREFPPLFNFTEEELRHESHLIPRLIPDQQLGSTSRVDLSIASNETPAGSGGGGGTEPSSCSTSSQQQQQQSNTNATCKQSSSSSPPSNATPQEQSNTIASSDALSSKAITSSSPPSTSTTTTQSQSTTSITNASTTNPASSSDPMSNAGSTSKASGGTAAAAP